MPKKPQAPPPKILDANQVVAYNFRAARELRHWTQEETARRLAPHLGQELPKASISGIERSIDGERKRFFDAQELVAFSLTFDLPIVWFLLPPPGDEDYQLAQVGAPPRLVSLLLGREDQLEAIGTRLEKLRCSDPGSAGEAVAEAGSFPAELRWEHFQRSRDEAIFALMEEETSEIERMLGGLRQVLERFDTLSQKTHFAAHPRTVYRAISHSLIGDAVFHKVLQSGDPADEGRYTRLRSRIPSPGPIEEAMDLDDPEIVRRLASVYDRAEELLAEKAARPRTRRTAPAKNEPEP